MATQGAKKKPWRWALPTIETHGRIASEDEEQIDFVRWCAKTYPDLLVHSIPNEGARSGSYGSKLKAKGLVPGMPDLHVPELSFWIEMKDSKGGDKGSAVQLVIHEKLRSIGDAVEICCGSVAAQSAIESRMVATGYAGRKIEREPEL